MSEFWELAKENPFAKKAVNWATAKANPLLKAAACKADPSTIKKTISMIPDEMLAKMIRSSSMCQSGQAGGSRKRRKTRKQKRKARKTRKH